MSTLAQTRGMTMEDARQTLETLAHVACRLAKAEARREARLAALESEHLEGVRGDRAEFALLEQRLVEYVRANPHLFQSPRMVQTPFGQFGCRRISDVHIDDEAALVQALLDRGHMDCLRVTQKPVRPALREHLDAGEVIPGASLRVSPDDPVVKVSSTLLEAATREV